MVGISSIYYFIVGLCSSSKANGKTEVSLPKEKKDTVLVDPLPPFDPTSFTEARYLPELNRLRQEELWKTSFTATIPRENYELREQMFLRNL